ncbi:hypothetical protein GEV33_009589 [Tenebrio molitor]|uniref:Uncharacterized protein n=1 Tax=Tenebrio molitor TaxID=7067 RepID=A0A8J6LAN5_TENMO|nr:hypothetical protein GEV33_009589 [Tenebrio molitor]
MRTAPPEDVFHATTFDLRSVIVVVLLQTAIGRDGRFSAGALQGRLKSVKVVGRDIRLSWWRRVVHADTCTAHLHNPRTAKGSLSDVCTPNDRPELTPSSIKISSSPFDDDEPSLSRPEWTRPKLKGLGGLFTQMADAMDMLEVRLQQITHVDRLDQKSLLQLSLVFLFSSIAVEYYEDHVGLKSDVLDIGLICQPLKSPSDTEKCNFISSRIKYSVAIRPMQTCISDLGLFTQVTAALRILKFPLDQLLVLRKVTV